LEFDTDTKVYMFFHCKAHGSYDEILGRDLGWEKQCDAPKYDSSNPDHALYMSMYAYNASADEVVNIPASRCTRTSFCIVFQFGSNAQSVTTPADPTYWDAESCNTGEQLSTGQYDDACPFENDAIAGCVLSNTDWYTNKDGCNSCKSVLDADVALALLVMALLTCCGCGAGFCWRRKNGKQPAFSETTVLAEMAPSEVIFSPSHTPHLPLLRPPPPPSLALPLS
jgi:hypothetical protein